jgi:acyl-CoA thioester hydrolase
MDRFTKTFEVRWADCDMNGHVRNTAYSEFCIESRMGFFAAHGFDYDTMRENGVSPVIFREETDYLREIGIGERVTVDLWLLGVSPEGAKFKFRHDLYREDGTHSARLAISGAWMDFHTRRIVAPPAALSAVVALAPRDPAYEPLPPLGSSRKR